MKTDEFVIRLSGCDDKNQFRVALTEAEATIISQLALASEETSEYGCQPTLSIESFEASDYDPDYTPTLIEWINQ